MALAVTRSVLEGNLEQAVLARATGSPAESAFDVMRQFLARQRPCTPERVRLYATSLDHLAKETRPGTRLVFSLDKDRSIAFVRGADGSIGRGGLSAALEARRRAAAVDMPTLLAEKIAPANVGRAALELETLFGPVAGAAVDYRPRIDLEESTKDLLFTNSRIFVSEVVEGQAKPITGIEFQFLKTDGDIEYDSVDYWDEIGKRPHVDRQHFRIPAKAVESSDIVSHWYSQARYDQGSLMLFFSRKMHRELRARVDGDPLHEVRRLAERPDPAGRQRRQSRDAHLCE